MAETGGAGVKYRAKPVVIYAWQYIHSRWLEFPDWVGQALIDRKIEVNTFSQRPELLVKTLEGTMSCEEGAWIIRGLEGELYPCKDSVFRAKYEEVGGGE